jgi:peptidoglycan/xylan/chitin deacetylase (PgdA/CDA1 family)
MLARTGVKSTVFACSGLARTGAPLAVPELDGRGGAERLATMSWDELRAHAEAGVEIGSHTITHAHLTELPDAELERELVDSKAEIETELGRPCRYVAYPFGENDARVRAAARGAGYELGFSLRATGGDADARFGCPRVDVYRRDGTLSFALKTSPARRPVVAVLDRLRAG